MPVNTGRPGAPPALLHQFFEEQASARPDQIAVISPSRAMTYAIVEKAANRLARFLRDRGVGPGCTVGLLLPRSADVYIGLLAILKAGAAYVPLDPDYPPERVSWILSDCKASFLVTVAELSHKADFSADAGSAAQPIPKVLLDKQRDELADVSAERLSPAETKTTPADLCYIIYTSGSTGKPKGVELEHQSVTNLVQVEREMFQVRPDDRVFQGFSIAFDASVEEVWLAFASGASLVVGTAEMVHAGPALARILTENHVSIWSTVPTLLSMQDEDVPTVRILILGGEACPPDLVQRFCRTGRRMFNTYGPTEGTVICTAWECVPGRQVTIGKPIPTYQIHLLDDAMQPVAPGKPGELYIGGVGVARGYVGRPDLTAERFLANPLPGGTGRLYRTGDLGRWTRDGEIEYLGRADSQVKLRGFRVELTEIENVLLECPGVKAAATAVHQDASGMQQLVGYLVAREGQELNEEAIRATLRSRLPHYMVPAVLETLTSLPTMPSGKVDRRALPAPKPRKAVRLVGGPDRPAPRTDLEKQIAAVWERLFSQPVSVRDDFFLDLGGHSLLASRLASELRALPNLGDVAVLDVYRHTTVESLAAHLEQRQQAAAANAGEVQPGNATPNEFFPASDSAHRLCGLAQMVALYFIVGFASLWLLAPYFVWTAMADHYRFEFVLLCAALSNVAVYPVMLALTILFKWVVIGRFQPGAYPLWGTYFFRWWLVRCVLAVVPTRVLAATPLINIYFRLMGAEIGSNVLLETEAGLAFDLLSIGDDAHVGADTNLTGCVIEGGLLKIGPIIIRKRCHIGNRCVLRPESTMGEAAVLEDLSLLRSENRIRGGKHRAGSPAAPAPDVRGRGKSSDAGGQSRPSLARRAVFSFLVCLSLLVFNAITFAAAIPGLLLLRSLYLELGGYWFLLFSPLAAAAFVLSFSLEVILLKWLIVGRVKPGRYPLYGLFHIRKWFVDTLMEMVLHLLMPVHTSLYQVPLYRLLGARIGRYTELSTATHVSPDLLTVGEGSFLADSVTVEAGRVEGGFLIYNEIRIGNKTFIGNNALLPPGTVVGDGCLIGCLSITPTEAEDALKPGMTWVGSPAFSLPRRQQSTEFPEEQTFRPTRAVWMQRALVEALRILLPGTVGFVLGSLVLLGMFHLQQISLVAAVLLLPLLSVLAGVAALLFAAGLKWVVMGRYTPKERPLWSPFVWGSELVTVVCESLAVDLMAPLLGTPAVCWCFRLLGSRIGKRVYMDTTDITEHDLVEIGDDTALNAGCTIQTHLFEDRVMKMSYVRIGNRCSVGAGALVLYDTHMADGSSLEELSLLMKGEALQAWTAWTGIPAIPAAKTPDPLVLATMGAAGQRGIPSTVHKARTLSLAGQSPGGESEKEQG